MRPSVRSAALLSLLSFVACLVACSAPGDDGVPRAESEDLGRVSAALDAVTSFGPNAAQLEMYKHVPAKVPAGPRPLVVALHGCTQTAAAYESTGWSDLADEWGFYVVYPQQNTTRNNSSGCFNWGGRWKSAPQTFVLTPEALDLNEIARGQGENESIKEMVDKMKADYAIDDKRVFVTGLSGGGAMTAVMLAVWPDVFAGGAIFAGIPYGCATSKKTTAEASECLEDYTGADAYLSRTPQAWGDLVRAAAPSFKGPYPRVSIWHGTADSVVNDANMSELVKQWTNANGIDQTADANDMVESFPHAEYKDASGKTLVETYTITGQSHGTEIAPNAPVDPGQPAGAKCGKPGAYILSAGICSTYYAAKFFGLDGAGDPSASGGDAGGTSGAATSGGTSGVAASSSTSTGGVSGAAASSGSHELQSAPSSCSATNARGSNGSSGGRGIGVALLALAVAGAASRRRRPASSAA
jgi:poly(hydroxyalkanoate) depolymerase family esterase